MAKRPGDITPAAASDVTPGAEAALDKYSDSSLARTDGPDSGVEMADSEAGAETEQIKAQIEETRAGLGETIDAIQERLSFANISEQVSEQVNNAIETAKESVYEATIGKVADFMKTTGREISRSSIVTAAKDNPLPFVLIGIGAGLLAYQGMGRSKGRSFDYQSPRRLTAGRRQEDGSMLNTAQEGLRSVTGTVSGAAGSAVDGVRTAAGSAVDGVRTAAGSAIETVKSAADSTYTGATDLANKAYEKAGDLGHTVQETYTHYLEEKPWAIGAVALAAGAAIGMAIPSSRYEGQLMGEARINLMNKVQDTATGFVEKAKEAATEAGRNVIDEAKSLTEETLG